MLVICPGCSIPYELPPHLVGPAGARVCCPVCRLAFVVDPSGELAAVLGHDEAVEIEASAGANGAAESRGTLATSPPAEEPPLPKTSSLSALHVLDDPPGTLAVAAAAGRLFANHGPALLDAFEAMERERPGEDVAAEFREALREVAGVELPSAAVEVEARENR